LTFELISNIDIIIKVFRKKSKKTCFLANLYYNINVQKSGQAFYIINIINIIKGRK